MRCPVVLVVASAMTAVVGASQASCGGVLRDPRGVLQTPGFPGTFPTPLHCRWVVDSSGWPNSTLILYLAQVFVTSGLTFTEYLHYEAGQPQYQLGRRPLIATPGATWVRSTRPYLVVELSLASLDGGAHLRALGGLMHVYGFNITYEAGTGALDPERSGACSVASCSFSGHCYASADYSQFRCACFDGFSGDDCGQGPLCRSGQHSCDSEQDCRQLGARVVRCRHHCVFGQNCHDSSDKLNAGCETEDCVHQCPYQPGDQACQCDQPSRVLTDRARYYATIRLANLTSVKTMLRHSSLTFQSSLEKQIGRYLRSSLTNITELEVLDVTSVAEVRFHFFAAKKDGSRVRDLLNRLVERGKLGNHTLLPTHIALKQEQTLFLKSVSVTPASRLVHAGESFSLSCTAHGSSLMTLRWFKDGLPVNTSMAVRSISVETTPPDPGDQHMSVLSVYSGAERLDEGTYTCQAVDWGHQQCRSLRLSVLAPPEINVNPRTFTAHKGQNVSIVCMSPNDGQQEKYGYSWAKGNSLLRMSPGHEVWEDLYPMGSILNIYNVQRSAVYKCVVHSSSGSRELGAQVEVVDRTAMPTCPAEGLLGADWPEAVPHARAVVDCPAPYIGAASRTCLMLAPGRAAWQAPDLSGCLDPQLSRLRDNFARLTLGYENTTAQDTIIRCVHYLRRSVPLLPGMGEPVVDLLSSVQYFLNKSTLQQAFLAASKQFSQAIDLLLDDKQSVRNDKSLVQLQKLIQSHGAMWASKLPGSPFWWLNLTSVTMEVMSVEHSEWFDYQLLQASNRYPPWMTDELDVHVEATQSGARNDTLTLAIIMYRNLSQFIPQRNMFRMGNGQEIHYEINSHIVTLDLQQDGEQILHDIFSISLQFNSVFKKYDLNEWDMRCGVTQFVSTSHPWDLDSCLMDQQHSLDKVRCRCSQPGTYAVLLTSKVMQAGVVDEEQHHVVLLGCMFCLLQTLFTLLLLLPYWWQHRSCIIYLKLQCCTATSGAMGIFIYAVGDSIPKGNFPYVTSSLEVLLLIGMSSHLSKVLVVYTEVVQLSKIRRLKQTVSSIITVVPVLAVVSSHLAHDSTGWPLKSWWLIFGTMMFNMFVTSVVIMTLLFIFLFCIVMQRLQLLSRKAIYENKSVSRRVGFLKRGATIFSFMVVMEASSVCYINFHAKTYHYMFSLSSAMLGFIIFVCYVWKSETPVCIQLLNRMKLGDSSQNKYNSDTVYSPFKLFAKQEGDVETEGAPPWSSRSQSQAEDAEQSQGLLMTESGLIRAPLPDIAPSTVETYVNSAESSFDGELANNPKKEFGSQLEDAEDSQEEKNVGMRKAGSFRYLGTVEVSPKSCTGGEETVITKVCVELGVITSLEGGGGAASDPQAVPAIILCSVDVEPCHQDTSVPAPETSFTQPVTTSFQTTPHSLQEAQKQIAKSEVLSMGAQGPQPLAQEQIITEEPTPESESDNIDCMLNRISHDLDYLLNRKSELGKVSLPEATLQQVRNEQTAPNNDKSNSSFNVR